MSGDAESVQSGAEANDQGAENSEGGGFYQTYLNEQVPEDYRPHVEPYLRDIENNANERFREHAEYKKQWEPYEGLNLNEYDPEGLQGLIEFAEKMQDEDSFKEWWTQVGQQQGFMNDLTSQDDLSDDGDFDGGDFEGLDLETIKGAVSELLDERLNPLQEREQERDQQQQLEAANDAIEESMGQLREEHGEFDEQAVLRFAYAHADGSNEDPIAAGFQDYQNFVAQIETGTVERKLGGPTPPESGSGPANTSQEAPSNWEEAKAMAKERFATQM